RVSEILLSRFEPHSAWSILFRDPSKKSPELSADFAIEIPTLAPAETVLAAITKLQRSLKVDDLKAAAHTMKGAKQKINQRYSAAISAACNRHFAGLVESREGRDDLYSHLFRAVYATIAAHWFCPPNVPEHNFKAEIQGHFTIAADGAKLPNYSARANYDDYAIGDGLGNRDGRLGIKLDLLDVQPIAAFKQGTVQDGAHLMASADVAYQIEQLRDRLDHIGQTDPAEYELIPFDDLIRPPNSLSKQQHKPMSQPKPSSLRIDGNHRDRWLDLLDDICPHCTNQLERMEALLVWAEGQLDLADQQTAQAEQQTQTQQQVVPELAKTLSWFTSRIETLEVEVTSLQSERDQLKAQAQPSPQAQQRIEELTAENQQIKTQLQQTQATLDNIRRSLGATNGAAVPAAAIITPAAPIGSETSPAPAQRPASTAQAASPQRQRDSSASTAKVHQIIDAIMAWNSAQDDSESMLRISIPIVKAIGTAMGASYQQSIQQVLKEREAELETMHSQQMLGVRHNASVQGRDSILQSIARDYLDLENWQEISATSS
ncbi:protelomerase family protein, partial [Rivularia sp. UHCC 0363]|uniref:protelomerase family protein n=1 Tax=Rivularia sp. UHCC 0363 TaxID=3110244 RepID=UPI002B2135E3